MRGCMVLVLLALCQSVVAQTTISTPLAITGLQEVRKVGDVLLVGEKSQPKLEPVLLIEVSTLARLRTSVTVYDSSNNVVPIKLVSDPALSDKKTVPKDQPLYFAYTVNQSGRFRVRTLCVDFESDIYDEFEDSFVVGPPPAPPKPPEPPKPPVPDDAFGNIGQRVATWSAGLPSNAAMAAAYNTAAKQLKTDPSQTIDSVTASLSTALRAVAQFEAYAPVTSQINADLQSRWPLSRGVLADYFAAVSVGFGGGK